RDPFDADSPQGAPPARQALGAGVGVHRGRPGHRGGGGGVELMADITKVGVLGAGLMGSGIAEVAAKSGYTTVVREVNEELTAKGRKKIEGSANKAVERGKLEAGARDALLGRLSYTTSLDAMADCDLVVEAIVENLGTKRETYATLDRVC